MCEHVNIGGTVAIICGGRHRAKRCKFCGRAAATKLCDFETKPGKTCDNPMCDRCATSVGEDRDHCPWHKERTAVAEAARQLSLL